MVVADTTTIPPDQSTVRAWLLVICECLKKLALFDAPLFLVISETKTEKLTNTSGWIVTREPTHSVQPPVLGWRAA